jgi:hypothetical protein
MNSRHQRRLISLSCSLLFLGLIPTSASFGQGAHSAAAPNIEILKLHWEKQVRLPRNFDPAIIPTGNSFNDPASITSVNNSNTETKTANTPRSAPGNFFPSTPGRLPVYYVYSLKLKNPGKLIEGVAWDYLFFDPGSHAELGHHQFVSYTRIPGNKVVTLEGQLRSPPIRVVRTSESSKTPRPKVIERAIIQCLLYGDDTMWKNPNAKEGLCEFLKNEKPLSKRKRSTNESQ